MKVSYHNEAGKYTTAACTDPEAIRMIMHSRVDFTNISNYNTFYFSENEHNEEIQFWVEANGNYAYLFFIDGDCQYQSLNDGNTLDPNGVTAIIPSDPVHHRNVYFVTIETAIDAAIEFCETKTRPTNVQWEPMQEE